MATRTATKPKPELKPSASELRKEEERALAVHTGVLIRARRKDLGLSQTMLGNALGITFQQIQKYEKGSNRVSGPMLTRMSSVLKVPIDYFFPKAGEPMLERPNISSWTLAKIETLARRVDRLADEIAVLVDEIRATQR